MTVITIILNLPWTILGLLGAIISIPSKIISNSRPPTLVIHISSFWWYKWMPGMKNIRAMAVGNVVLLGKNILEKDLEHELVHVEQAMRTPLVHPLLYWIETLRKGYKDNKYEKEAYSKAQNIYIEN